MRNVKLMVAGAGCAAVMLLPGCGGDDSGAPAASMPPPVQTQVLDTEQLLVLAQMPSETADPLPVGPTATTVADMGDETSDPIAVTATAT